MPRIILPVAYRQKLEGGFHRSYPPKVAVEVSDREALRLKGKYGDGIVLPVRQEPPAVVSDPPVVSAVPKSGGAEGGERVGVAPSAFDHDGDGADGGSLPAATQAEIMTPQALIAADADGLGYHSFVAEAQKTLGNRMPKSRRKEAILKALGQAAEHRQGGGD